MRDDNINLQLSVISVMPLQQILVIPVESKNSITEKTGVAVKQHECKDYFSSVSPTFPASMERRHSSQPSTFSASSILGGCNALMVERDICRICHCEADLDFPLISPCFCAGSLRYVHQGCLQQWIKSSDTRCCELCKFEFIMHTKIKPFRKWEKLEMSAVEQRKVLCSITFHVVAITCVVWALYVLIERTAEEMRLGILEWTFWVKLVVVAIGFTGGLVFMYVQCKIYANLFRRWRAFNRIIYVQDAPEKVALKLASMNEISLAPNLTNSRLTSDCNPAPAGVLERVINDKLSGSPVEEYHSCHGGSVPTLNHCPNAELAVSMDITSADPETASKSTNLTVMEEESKMETVLNEGEVETEAKEEVKTDMSKDEVLSRNEKDTVPD